MSRDSCDCVQGSEEGGWHETVGPRCRERELDKWRALQAWVESERYQEFLNGLREESLAKVQALRLQLEATEKAIFDIYQRFHAQNPALRPVEAGQLGALWNVFDECVFELGLAGEEP